MGAIEINDFSGVVKLAPQTILMRRGSMATPPGLVSLVRLTTWGGELVLALLLKATNRLEIEAKPFRKGNPLRSVAWEKNSLKGVSYCNQARR